MYPLYILLHNAKYKQMLTHFVYGVNAYTHIYIHSKIQYVFVYMYIYFLYICTSTCRQSNVMYMNILYIEFHKPCYFFECLCTCKPALVPADITACTISGIHFTK